MILNTSRFQIALYIDEFCPQDTEDRVIKAVVGNQKVEQERRGRNGATPTTAADDDMKSVGDAGAERQENLGAAGDTLTAKVTS